VYLGYGNNVAIREATNGMPIALGHKQSAIGGKSKIGKNFVPHQTIESRWIDTGLLRVNSYQVGNIQAEFPRPDSGKSEEIARINSGDNRTAASVIADGLKVATQGKGKNSYKRAVRQYLREYTDKVFPTRLEASVQPIGLRGATRDVVEATRPRLTREERIKLLINKMITDLAAIRKLKSTL
jgi:hypothetical protein